MITTMDGNPIAHYPDAEMRAVADDDNGVTVTISQRLDPALSKLLGR